MTAATATDVARLFGRAAFGATKADLDRWTGAEYEDVVASLFPPATRVPEPDEPRRVNLEGATSDKLAIQRWWLERMRTAMYPFEERMTWLWHSHFATAYAGNPNAGDLIKQNQKLRLNALGSFRALVEQLTVDVAMLYWLSGTTNRRGSVNENYARELFELFTAGTLPQVYDETTVRESAKALTGWVVLSDRTPKFDTNRHDRTVKHPDSETSIGGYPANDPREATEYLEVVDYALRLSSTARFVAYKMVCSFAYVPQTVDLLGNPDPLVDAVAASFGPGWNIRDAMWTLLTHDLFRNAPGQVRQPVELAVHLAKAMGIDCDPPGGLTNTSASDVNRPILALRRMGQVPFEPPNVGGWPKGNRWLSSTTTIGRYSLGQYLTQASTTQNSTVVTPLPPSGDLAAWASFLGLGALAPLTLQQCQAYLANPGTTDERTKQNSVLFLIESSPQWQVM